RNLVEKCSEVMGVPATYVQATPDLMMGDLLKNMRSSQIFSVCGLPEVKVSKVQSPKSKVVSYGENVETKYQVELLGLDVFDVVIAGQQQITRDWWEERRLRYELYISVFVLDEIHQGDVAAAAARAAAVKGCQVLDYPPAAEALTRTLLASRVVPAKAAVDAA